MERQNGLDQPVSTIARRDVMTLDEGFSVREALDHIRSHGLGERIVYFYVVDQGGRLKGVIPTRRLLTMPLHQRVSELLIPKLVTIHRDDSILKAYEALVQNKLLAIPVVDDDLHVTGVIDVGMLTEDNHKLEEREQIEEIFETIGFRISDMQTASSIRIFSLRFRWLLATIASGTLCAILTGIFHETLARSLVLAFFLTLVLGLGESVSMQSMTVTIHALRRTPLSVRWWMTALWRETRTALLLGLACGLAVGVISQWLHGSTAAAVSIGASIALTICAAGGLGVTIPSLLHALELDPKIAAGPLTLALADICTILIYFFMATLLL